jgi:hypothetical protein
MRFQNKILVIKLKSNCSALISVDAGVNIVLGTLLVSNDQKLVKFVGSADQYVSG